MKRAKNAEHPTHVVATAAPYAVRFSLPSRAEHLAFHEAPKNVGRDLGLPKQLVAGSHQDFSEREIWVLCVPYPPRGDVWQQARSAILQSEGGPDSATIIEFETEDFCAVWHNGNVLVSAAPDVLSELEAPLAEFSFCQLLLTDMENEVADRWSVVEKDALLTGHAKGSKTQMQGLGQRISLQHQQNLRYARLSERFRLLLPGQDRCARPLIRRLLLRTHTARRLEILGEHLEARHSVYEQLSYRMADHKAARLSFVVELVIVALLLMEVGISVLNLWWDLAE